MKTSLAFLLVLLGSASAFLKFKIKATNDLASTFLKILTKETNEHLLYPYGEAAGDMKNPKEDDGTSPEVPISVPFTYYGKTYRSVYINNNGVLSFSVPVPEYTPKAIPMGNGKAFVAPYWADANIMLGGQVFYRQTQKPELLRSVTLDINTYFPEIPFRATWLFIATWDHVAYFGSLSRKVNTFQAILCTDGHVAFIMLNYIDIQWTTGVASQGNPMTGLGGIAAQAGFDSGNDKNYYNIPSSRTPQVINITKTSNVGVPGRWVFRVDNFISPGDTEQLTHKEKELETSEEEEEPEVNMTHSEEDLPEQETGHLNHEQQSQEVHEQQSQEVHEQQSQEVHEQQSQEVHEQQSEEHLGSDEDESDHCE